MATARRLTWCIINKRHFYLTRFEILMSYCTVPTQLCRMMYVGRREGKFFLFPAGVYVTRIVIISRGNVPFFCLFIGHSYWSSDGKYTRLSRDNDLQELLTPFLRQRITRKLQTPQFYFTTDSLHENSNSTKLPSSQTKQISLGLPCHYLGGY